jgi:hypothetical protein
MRYALIYFLLLHFCFAQAQIRFNINLPIGIDTVADLGTKVIELRNNEFLSCGTTSGFMINYNAAYLVKTDPYGNPIWKKQFDFSIGGFDCFYDLVQLPDSNYIVTGTTTNTLTGDYDVILAKIDTAGNLMWQKTYTHPDYDQAAALKLTPDGKIIIVGKTESLGTYHDVLLIKTDLNGNLIWRKRFGNTFDEIYNSIEIIKNNTEYLLGGRYGYSSSGTDYYDMSIMRTDTAGNIVWQQQYGTVGGNEYGGIAISTLDSGYAICGIYNNSAAVLKINKFGAVQWNKNYGFPSNSFMRQVIQLKDSSFAMIASSAYIPTNSLTAFLLKADKNGNQMWQRVYPGPTTIPNYFYGFNTTADKGFIMTGQYNHIGQPYQNMWLVKTDSLGCDSVTCSYLVTGMEDLSYELGEMSLAPNPTNGLLTISSQNDFTKIDLLSLTGQILLSETVDSKTHQLELQNFAEGIYFVRVSYADGQSVTKKVILSR